MGIVRINNCCDVHWNTIDGAANDLTRLAAHMGLGMLPIIKARLDNVRNLAQSIRDMNRQQQREYDLERDRAILILADQIGTMLHDEDWNHSLHSALPMFRGRVSQMRGALAARMTTYTQDSAQRVQQRRQA